jgi:predicted DNA-binding protein (MmcQ/YjbR family)
MIVVMSTRAPSAGFAPPKHSRAGGGTEGELSGRAAACYHSPQNGEERCMSARRRTAALQKYLETMPGAAATPVPVRQAAASPALMFKVMGKIFAILSVRGDEFVILKCDPHLVEMLRGQYAGVGRRSHLDPRFWIAVDLESDVPAKEVKRLAAHSYEIVRAGLTRKKQAELKALSA